MRTAVRELNPAAAVLWASAFIIAAFVILQAGRLPINAAHASIVASQGDYLLLTAKSGRGSDVDPDELLYVIDNRDQTYFIYEIENITRKQMLLRAGGSLDALFRTARP